MPTPRKPTEFICQIDGGVSPTVDTAWTVSSPDTTVWLPSVTTAGILSFASGGVALNTPDVPGVDGSGWDLTISNGGVLTVTQGGFLSSSDSMAAVNDSNSITWSLFVGEDNQVRVTTDSILDNVFYYPAIVITFIPSATTDVFDLYSIKPDMKIRRR